MAEIAITESTLATLGDAVAFANASDAPAGDEYENDGSVQLFVSLAAAPRTITIHGQRSCNYGETHDIVEVLATAGGYIIPPLDPHFFNQANGRVKITVSDKTGVQYLALRSRDAKR